MEAIWKKNCSICLNTNNFQLRITDLKKNYLHWSTLKYPTHLSLWITIEINQSQIHLIIQLTQKYLSLFYFLSFWSHNHFSHCRTTSNNIKRFRSHPHSSPDRLLHLIVSGLDCLVLYRHSDELTIFHPHRIYFWLISNLSLFTTLYGIINKYIYI